MTAAATPLPVELSPTVDAAADAASRMIGTVLMHNKLTDTARTITASELVRADHAAVWALFEILDLRGECITREAVNTLAAQRGDTSRLPDGGCPGWDSEYISRMVLPQIEPQMVALIKAQSTRHTAEVGLTDALLQAKSGAPAADVAENVVRLAGRLTKEIAPDAPLTRKASSYKPQSITWIQDGYLAKGEPMAVVGAAGLGKSTSLIEVAARVSTGRAQYGSSFTRPPADVFIYAVEDSIEHVIIAKLRAARADEDRVYFWDPAEPLQFPKDVDRFLAEVKRLPRCELVIFDPLISTLQAGLSPNCDAHIRQAFTPLFSGLRALGVASASIRHPNKKTGIEARDKASGSPALTALMRTEFYLGRAEEDPSNITMACIKTNLGKMPEAIQFRLDVVDDTVRVEYLGRSDTTANDLVADPMVRAARATAKADAVEKIVLDMGADGEWHTSAELDFAIKQAGASIATLRRVKKDLGVVNERQKRPPRAWYWYLPTGAHPTPARLDAHLEGVSDGPNEHLQSDEHLQDASLRNEHLQTHNINYLERENSLGNVGAHQESDTPILNEHLQPKEADEPLPDQHGVAPKAAKRAVVV